MNVLVIGAGGREHALVSKLHQSPLIEKLYAIPGNDAMTHLAEIHTEIAETDHKGYFTICSPTSYRMGDYWSRTTIDRWFI